MYPYRVVIRRPIYGCVKQYQLLLPFNTARATLLLVSFVMILVCLVGSIYKTYAQLPFHSNIPGIKVGNLPECIFANQDRNLIYVCNAASNTISVIDGTTNTLNDTIFVGQNFPLTIALDALTERLYVGAAYSNKIKEIDTVTNNVIGTIPLENVTLSMVSDQFGHLFVTKQFSEKIATIDAESHKVKENSYKFGNKGLADDLSAMTFNPLTHKLFVVKNSNNTVYVFDVAYNGVLKLDGTFVMERNVYARDVAGIDIDPVTNLVYLANTQNASISVINATSHYAVIQNLPIKGAQPEDIAVNPITHIVYVVDPFSGIAYVINSKCIIDHRTCNIIPVKVASPFAPGEHESGIAVNPNTNMIYVTNQGSKTVSVINGKTNRLSVSVNFNVSPEGSGYIVCDSQKITNQYMFYDVNSTHKCSAVPGNDFVFSSWSNRGSNTNFTGPINFKALDFGISWTANFDRKSPIPKEFLYGVVLGPTVGGFLGGFFGWLIPYFMNKRAKKK
jgi:YVTN family beta-propeller protein